jgi:uncharacterized hydrophobic protein (TIGR00271 family)
MKNIILAITLFLRERFNISHEQEDNLETIKSIEKGVEFRGINVWTLIFAIFIASIGLNVNSTAVIIGAMLISPLMGPIMGLGLSVGIYDFALLKISLKNLSIAVIISVITSAIYFAVSPLDDAQSELLARTTPTIYDVLIALFGGLAGIISGATKEKGNAIPGVAIATALMPPLCTAGFGIAIGNLYYFLGAFYLFFINTIMISFATLLMVRFLKFPLKQIVDKAQSKRVKNYITLIVLITVLPSIYFAYQIVQQAIFRNNAIKFINKEIKFDKTQVLSKSLTYNKTDSNLIEVFLAGEVIKEEIYNLLKKRMPEYALFKTKLILKQGREDFATMDFSQIKSGIIEELYIKNEQLIKNKDEKIKLLENKILLLQNNFPINKVSEEINAINPKITKFSAYKSVIYDIDKMTGDTTIIVYVSTKSKLNINEHQIIKNWLAKRLDFENIKIIAQVR